MDKKWYIIGGIILVLLISFYRNRNVEQGMEEIPAEEIITQEDGTVVKKTGDLIEQISPEELERTKLEIEEKVATSEPVDMKAYEGEVGMGKSYRMTENGSYFQKIEVEGMTPLAKGYFYQAWLEKSDGSRISIGRLEMSGATGTAYYSAKADKSDYSKVVVSREIEDGNAEIGEVVLSGIYE